MYKKVESEILSQCCQYINKIYHIGSTSIPFMMAKPVLDILIDVKPNNMDKLNLVMKQMNYRSKGEFGLSGRSYFTKPKSDDQIAIHVHCFESNHPEIEKHIAFRDYLISHRKVANDYSELKKKILSINEITRDKYQELKNDFLTKTTEAAKNWFSGRPQNEKAVLKSVIYAVRNNNGQNEVLVFDHVKYPEVSPQVPSGTVELTEPHLQAAKREFFEETGIDTKSDFMYLGHYIYYKAHSDQFQERHLYMLKDDLIPEVWSHFVTGSGEDQSLEFRYYWISISKA